MSAEWYTAKELAERCTPQLTKKRIIQLIIQGDIAGEKAQGMFGIEYWRVSRSEGDRFIRHYKKND